MPEEITLTAVNAIEIEAIDRIEHHEDKYQYKIIDVYGNRITYFENTGRLRKGNVMVTLSFAGQKRLERKMRMVGIE